MTPCHGVHRCHRCPPPPLPPSPPRGRYRPNRNPATRQAAPVAAKELYTWPLSSCTCVKRESGWLWWVFGGWGSRQQTRYTHPALQCAPFHQPATPHLSIDGRLDALCSRRQGRAGGGQNLYTHSVVTAVTSVQHSTSQPKAGERNKHGKRMPALANNRLPLRTHEGLNEGSDQRVDSSDQLPYRQLLAHCAQGSSGRGTGAATGRWAGQRGLGSTAHRFALACCRARATAGRSVGTPPTPEHSLHQAGSEELPSPAVFSRLLAAMSPYVISVSEVPVKASSSVSPTLHQSWEGKGVLVRACRLCWIGACPRQTTASSSQPLCPPQQAGGCRTVGVGRKSQQALAADARQPKTGPPGVAARKPKAHIRPRV